MFYESVHGGSKFQVQSPLYEDAAEIDPLFRPLLKN